jgi:hypothetical protein
MNDEGGKEMIIQVATGCCEHANGFKSRRRYTLTDTRKAFLNKVSYQLHEHKHKYPLTDVATK